MRKRAKPPDCGAGTFLPQKHTRHTLPVNKLTIMHIAYATKLWQTRQGSKSPLRLQMTCSRIRKKLYSSIVVKSANHQLLSLTDGLERSRQNGGKHQTVGATNFITISRPVMERLINGETKGLLVRPLGALVASFYASENQAGKYAAKLHFNLAR